MHLATLQETHQGFGGIIFLLSVWVAAASKCCEFWGFLSKLYTGLCYLLKAAIFMLNCCHDLYFTPCTCTLKNYYLALKKCFGESSVKFCAKSYYLLACFFGLVQFGELFISW